MDAPVEDGSAEPPGIPVAEVAARYLPDSVMVLDAGATVLWVSDAVRDQLGYEPSELMGTSAFDLLHPDDQASALDGFTNVLTFPGRLAPSVYRVRTAAGSWLPMEIAGDTRLHDPDVAVMVISARDVSHRTALDAVLKSLASGAVLDDTLELLADAMTQQLHDQDVVICFEGDDGTHHRAGPPLPDALTGAAGAGPWNEAVRRTAVVVDSDLTTCDPAVAELARSLGYVACAALPVADFGGRSPSCMMVWSKDARLLPVALTWATDVPRELAELALERRHHLAALEHAARHDPLTRLPNRAVFFDGLAHDHRQHPDGGRALLYLDLDDFKQINDTHGHLVGDRYLETLADRLQELLRPGDVVARLGGDEFAVLLPGADREDAVGIVERLLDHIGQPVEVGGLELRPSISIGVAIDERTGVEPELLVDRADEALYEAKRRGKGSFVVAVG